MTFTSQDYLLLAIGLSFLGFGWVLVRFGVRMTGMASGFMFGFGVYQLVVVIVEAVEPQGLQYVPDNLAIALMVGAFCGVIGLFVAQKIYQIAIFLGSLSAGLFIMYKTNQRELVEQLFTVMGILEPLYRTLGNAWPAILAVLIALLFVYMQRQMMILLTACIGALLISNTVEIPILFLPLCFIGYILQQKTKSRPRVVKKEVEE
jgi:predicted membrane protein